MRWWQVCLLGVALSLFAFGGWGKRLPNLWASPPKPFGNEPPLRLPVASGSTTQPVPSVRSLFVIVCDGLTWTELERLGEPMPSLLRSSAIGLLSGASLELQGREGVYVTLGSGTRAKSTDRALLGSWLHRFGKRMTLQGDGALAKMVGVSRSEKAKVPKGDVVFLSVPPSQLLPTLRQVLTALPDEGSLWLLLPNSPQTDWQNRRLTPVLLFGAKVPTGLLTSPTTRRVGLVSSVDFAPTLLSQLGLPIPATMTGRVMRIVVTEKRDVERRQAYLRWLDERAFAPLRNLPTIANLVASVIAIALLLTTLSVIASSQLPSAQLKVADFLQRATLFVVVTGLALPATLFLVGGAMVSTPAVLVVQILLVAAGTSGAAFITAKWALPSSPFPASLKAAGIVCATTAVVALLGLPLYWATPLGYYPTTGWRYFGITNAGIGLVLAGTIFAWQTLSLPKRAMLWWCLVAPFLMGAPRWGANFGGALTLAVGFAVAWEWLTKPKPSWGTAFWRSLLAAIAVTGALALLESFLPADERAHFGLLLDRITQQGITALIETLQRKITLMSNFFVRTPLSVGALALFVVAQVAYLRLAQRWDLFIPLRPAFVATSIGSWVGFFVNDSGIEVVGMALVPMGAVTMLLAVETVRSRAIRPR